MRRVLPLPAPALLLLAGACHRPEPQATHTGDTADTESTPTPTDFDGFVPAAFGITRAEFAVGADGAAEGWTTAAGDAAPATIVLTLVDATWAEVGPTDQNQCEFTWTWSGPIAPTDAPATDAFARWNPHEDAGARLTETCSALEFPPKWADAVADHVWSWEFGVGVGPLDAGVRQSLEDSFGEEFDRLIPYVAGGGFWWDGLVGRTDVLIPERWTTGWVNTSVVYAYELDAEGREVLDGGLPVQLLAEDVPKGRGGVVPARYLLQGTTLISPAEALIPPE